MQRQMSESLTVDGAAGRRSPVLAHVLHYVLPVRWVPHCVACCEMIEPAPGDHHAALHIAASCLTVENLSNGGCRGLADLP